MLIDLLDKKAATENYLVSLHSNIKLMANTGSTANKLSEVTVKALDLIDKIRNYDLLIAEEKTKLTVNLSKQTFNLNELECLSKAVQRKIKVLDVIIEESIVDFNVVDLLEQRNKLQTDLDAINKAGDEAMWRKELNDG